MEKERAPGLLGAGSCTQNLIYSIQIPSAHHFTNTQTNTMIHSVLAMT